MTRSEGKLCQNYKNTTGAFASRNMNMPSLPFWKKKAGSTYTRLTKRRSHLFTLREDEEERFDNSFSMQLQIRINKNIFVMLMR